MPSKAPQGIVDDIFKAGVKGVGKAIRLTAINKKTAKKIIKTNYPMVTKSGEKLNKAGVKGLRADKKAGYKASGHTSYRANIKKQAAKRKPAIEINR